MPNAYSAFRKSEKMFLKWFCAVRVFCFTQESQEDARDWVGILNCAQYSAVSWFSKCCHLSSLDSSSRIYPHLVCNQINRCRRQSKVLDLSDIVRMWTWNLRIVFLPIHPQPIFPKILKWRNPPTRRTFPRGNKWPAISMIMRVIGAHFQGMTASFKYQQSNWRCIPRELSYDIALVEAKIHQLMSEILFLFTWCL